MEERKVDLVDNIFVAAEAYHAIGISLLIYKLTKEKTAILRSEVDCRNL